jgi:hypothetical protein
MAANSLIISLLHRAFTLVAISIYAIEKHVVDMWVLFSVLRDFVKKKKQFKFTITFSVVILFVFELIDNRTRLRELFADSL